MKMSQRNHTGNHTGVCLCAPFFSPLRTERRQTKHPGSPEDQFCVPSGKGNLLPSAYSELLEQVMAPPHHKRTL